MAKLIIPAGLAVEDVRSGMDDSDLMRKYNVSPKGLRSLFTKLVQAGLIEQSEIDERIPAFVGTVILSEDLLAPTRDMPVQTITIPPVTQTPPKISAREALQDIKSEMSDLALIEKYKLSAKGLESLFRKLTERGLVDQSELDRRLASFEATVDLSATIDELGFGAPSVVTEVVAVAPPAPEVDRAVQGMTQAAPTVDQVAAREVASPPETESPLVWRRSRIESDEGPGVAHKPPWYDRPIVVWTLLIFLFPLGLYALYRNTRVPSKTKAFIAFIWVALALACAMFVVEAAHGQAPFA